MSLRKSIEKAPPPYSPFRPTPLCLRLCLVHVTNAHANQLGVVLGSEELSWLATLWGAEDEVEYGDSKMAKFRFKTIAFSIFFL